MKKFQVLAFCRYYWRACTIYDIHSPYLFALVESLMDQKLYYAMSEIEPYRDRYKTNSTQIKLLDFGAGGNSGKLKTVAQIVKTASSRPQKCRFIFNLVKYFQPESILELGTNLGIATAYMSMAHSNSKLYTVEADPGIVEHAEELFSNLNIKQRIEVINTSFQTFFRNENKIIDSIDFAFVDGDHSFESTIDTVSRLMRNSQDRKVLILDDIYWSKPMHEAWIKIKDKYSDCLFIELMHMGIIIKDEKCPISETVSLIPWKLKPWRIGLTSGKH